MAGQKGLGKGLGALMGDFLDEPVSKSPYQLLPIHKVEPNPGQPRQDFDEEELQALSESIATHGVCHCRTGLTHLLGGFLLGQTVVVHQRQIALCFFHRVQVLPL